MRSIFKLAGSPRNATADPQETRALSLRLAHTGTLVGTSGSQRQTKREDQVGLGRVLFLKVRRDLPVSIATAAAITSYAAK